MVTGKIESQEADLGQLSKGLTSAARGMRMASSSIHEEAQNTRVSMTASAAYIEQISVTMDAISSRGQTLVESFKAIEQLVPASRGQHFDAGSIRRAGSAGVGDIGQ